MLADGSDRDRAARLEDYRSHRDAAATPEPFDSASYRPGAFVVQLHDASTLHYDLRLEIDGVLRSWAVPKGPSLDPADKRLAIETEDHPVDYVDFEGIIPEGQYGAGAMIVWDKGRWVRLEDDQTGPDKLLFRLQGYKLHGTWTLVRTRRNEREWLLIKKDDAFARPDVDAELSPRSVLSGLTVEELPEAGQRAAELHRRLEELGAPRRQVDPHAVEPMLAKVAEHPFSRSGWWFELKYDGYRLLAAAREEGPLLRYRSARVATATFPELARALAALPFDEVLLDGEAVVLDAGGRPDFGLLQQRTHVSRPSDVERAAVASPATLFAFDLLALDGFDLRPLSLRERKAVLRQVVPDLGPVRYADHVEDRGEDFYDAVHRMELEGMMGKDASSPYRGGRSARWVKVRADRTGRFVVVGATPTQGSRTGFGALHVAGRDGGGELVYAGRVGSGFDVDELDDLADRLAELQLSEPVVDVPAEARAGDDLWAEPRLLCEVRYKEWTHGGMLRQPVFVRLRDDLSPDAEALSVRPSDGDAVTRSSTDEPPPQTRPADADGEPGNRVAEGPATSAPPPEDVAVSNPDKTFWPQEGYTKSDLVSYYATVADHILPFLRDRPLVLDRYPDGIDGESFYQKNAPDHLPGWMRTVGIRSEGVDREIRYIVCDDEASLRTVANLASIPLHVWASRAGSLDRPDWCILDLDPKDAPFEHVVTVARAIRELCADINLPCFAKTSGGSGLHVLLPLGRQLGFEQCRGLGELLGRIIAREHADVATVERSLPARAGRVYIDYLQNGEGKLLVAPYSVRPYPGAPVSTPLRWREVKPSLDVARFNLRSVPRRLAQLKDDPLLPVLDETPDLLGALERLATRFS